MALTPTLADDDEAIAVLIQAAEHPRAFDHGFSEPFAPPAYRLMLPTYLPAWPHETLIHTACERVDDFSRLVQAAVAAVDLRAVHRPTPQFGPYLRIAFADGPPPSGECTPEQRAFAHAIADRDELWDGTYHRVGETFAAAALPTTREEWRQLSALPTDTSYESMRLVAFETRAAVRRHPRMFLNVARTDPDLVARLVDVIRRQDGMSVHIGPKARPTVDAAAIIEDPAELDAVATSQTLGDRNYFGLAVAATLSLWSRFTSGPAAPPTDESTSTAYPPDQWRRWPPTTTTTDSESSSTSTKNGCHPTAGAFRAERANL